MTNEAGYNIGGPKREIALEQGGGKPAILNCPECGAENIQGTDYCVNCNSDLRTLDIPPETWAPGEGPPGERVLRLARADPLTVGPRTPLRRAFAQTLARINEALDGLPPLRWLHRRVQPALQFPELRFSLTRGGPGLDGLRIAFLSDIHAGSFLDADDLCGICERVAATEPHLVLFGGDLTRPAEDHLLRHYSGIAATAPLAGGAAAHRTSPGGASTARTRCAISRAARAASSPLLPSAPPARASACSTSSVVSTPNATGTPVSRITSRTPSVTARHT